MRFQVDLFIHDDNSDTEDIPDWARPLFSKLNILINKGDRLMATVAQLNDKIDALDLKLDSVRQLIADLRTAQAELQTRIDELIANGGITPEIQAGIDAANTKLDNLMGEMEKALGPTPVDPPITTQ